MEAEPGSRGLSEVSRRARRRGARILPRWSSGGWPLLFPGAVAAVADAGRPWPPLRLAETGLYRDAPGGAVAADVRPYSPQYPLWTDGATKLRWIALPPGGTIDASDAEAWRFPTGTRFWKEFSFGGRRVETRYIEKTGEKGWIFAAYVWSADEGEAILAPAATGLRNHVEVAPGVRHDIPSVGDCRACHEGQGRESVLGFEALQLSSVRDALAPHAEPPPPGGLDLTALLEEERLRNAPAAWRAAPPVIIASSPRARAALGYLHGNCSFCHNDRDPVASVGLSLRASLAAGRGDDHPAVRTAVGVRSKYQIRGVPAGRSLRLSPGDLEHSALVVRMRLRDGLGQMPPLGSKLVDDSALALISDWVREELPFTVSPARPDGDLRNSPAEETTNKEPHPR